MKEAQDWEASPRDPHPHVHMHTTHTCAHTDSHMYLHTYTSHTHALHAYTHMCSQMHMRVSFIPAQVGLTHIHKHTCVHTHTHTHTHLVTVLWQALTYTPSHMQHVQAHIESL